MVSHGRQVAISAGFGLRLPDSPSGISGRHLRTFARKISSRVYSMAPMILVRSWPAFPMKGSPRRSSSSPGASPTKSSSAKGWPTPQTTCARLVTRLGQRVQVRISFLRTSSFARRPSSSAMETARGAGVAEGGGGYFTGSMEERRSRLEWVADGFLPRPFFMSLRMGRVASRACWKDS